MVMALVIIAVLSVGSVLIVAIVKILGAGLKKKGGIMDKSGARHEIARLGDCYITMRWSQGPSILGIESSAFLKFEVFKGNDPTPITSAQIFLRNVKRISDPDPMPPFDVDWGECMDTFDKRIEAADIDVTVTNPTNTYAEQVWDHAEKYVGLKKNEDEKLRLSW